VADTDAFTKFLDWLIVCVLSSLTEILTHCVFRPHGWHILLVFTAREHGCYILTPVFSGRVHEP